MKFVIKPNKSFFKPAPWRPTTHSDGTIKPLLESSTTAKYLIIEVLKTKSEADNGDDVHEFGTSNEKIMAQGPGFSLRRLHSGQIKHVYAIEFAIDRMQVYVAKHLDKVCLSVCCPFCSMFNVLLCCGSLAVRRPRSPSFLFRAQTRVL
jgi:hypothetical protein